MGFLRNGRLPPFPKREVKQVQDSFPQGRENRASALRLATARPSRFRLSFLSTAFPTRPFLTWAPRRQHGPGRECRAATSDSSLVLAGSKINNIWSSNLK